MSVKLSQAENVAILRAAIQRHRLRCVIFADEGLFRFHEKGQRSVFYFPKKNRYRRAGDPVDRFAPANVFIEWYVNSHLGRHCPVFVRSVREEQRIARERGGEATKRRTAHTPAPDLNWSEGPGFQEPRAVIMLDRSLRALTGAAEEELHGVSAAALIRAVESEHYTPKDYQGPDEELVESLRGRPSTPREDHDDQGAAPCSTN